MEITVYHGAEALETRESRVVRLPDGREGAIWRGLAYGLDGGGINVSVPGVSPALCREREALGGVAPYALRETVGGG